MLFCQLLFQERSAKQSTGCYVFAHCSFLGSNSSPTGRKVWKLWVPIHQSSLMQVYYISGFQRCFRCRVPKPDLSCDSWDFLGWLSVSTIIYGYICYLYTYLLYSGELGQQAHCSLSRFLGKSGNSWPWMPTSTAPNIFEDLRHAAIMQLPPRRYHGHAREVLIRIIQAALEHSFHVFPAWLTKRNLPKMTSSNLGVSWSLHCLKHFCFFSLSLSQCIQKAEFLDNQIPLWAQASSHGVQLSQLLRKRFSFHHLLVIYECISGWWFPILKILASWDDYSQFVYIYIYIDG